MTLLYLGCAAALLATVMLGLPGKMRAGFFTAMLVAAVAGGHSPQVEHVAGDIIAMTD